ncbi:MAG TPA: helix-turn-helix transcriptional regulator [Steroidobacteraceae bacterium]|nr:helix-turn-helix transcriptional regulator [Steroidobacteraceae bacterium]
MKNTDDRAEHQAPRLTPDQPRGATAVLSGQWPFVERRKADRRQQTRAQDELLHEFARLCTSRELQTVQLVLRGMTNKQIAQELGIAEDTVKKHLHHVYRKLGVRSRAVLMAGATGSL